MCTVNRFGLQRVVTDGRSGIVMGVPSLTEYHLLADPRRVGEGVRRCSSRASKPATPIRRRRGHRLAPAAVRRGGR
jgi:hypothetical protein